MVKVKGYKRGQVVPIYEWLKKKGFSPSPDWKNAGFVHITKPNLELKVRHKKWKSQIKSKDEIEEMEALPFSYRRRKPEWFMED